MTDQPNSVWHIDKRITVSHIFTTVAALVAIILGYANLQAQIEKNVKRMDYIEQGLDGNFVDIKRRLERIEDLVRR